MSDHSIANFPTEHSFPPAQSLAIVRDKPMQTDQSTAQSTAQSAAQSPGQSFGDLLRARREFVLMSVSELARRTGLSRGTIRNLESGRTAPTPDSVHRLSSVFELALPNKEHPREARFAPSAWLSPRYDPLQLASDMAQVFSGPGGTLEQTFAYLDPQSAADWYEYSNLPAYVENFRDKIPVDALGRAVVESIGSKTLDLVALGVGDGKSETRLTHELAKLLGGPALRMYLLEISHPLLVTAYKHAVAGLPPELPVFPIHGNFLDLSRVLPLQQQPGRERRRVWTMFGNTLGNLAHEPSFLADLSASSRAGDLLLLDVQKTWAPARDLKAIRRDDPIFRNPIHPVAERWLSGPILRHCRAAREVRFELAPHNRCTLAGSYEITFCATATLDDGRERRFEVFRVRRYDVPKLTTELDDLGWRCVFTTLYGPAPEHMALLLLQKK